MVASVKAVAITKQVVLRDWAKRPGFELDITGREAKLLRFISALEFCVLLRVNQI